MARKHDYVDCLLQSVRLSEPASSLIMFLNTFVGKSKASYKSENKTILIMLDITTNTV